MKPVTRKEAYWAAMADDSITPPEPQTTEECILAAMSGNYPADKIEPQTREQELMKQAAVKMGTLVEQNVEWVDGLTTIDFGNENYRTAFKSLVIPAGVETIASGAFDGCTTLESVSVPASVKKIFGGAFNNCTALKKVVLAEGLVEIQGGTFDGCTALTEIVLPATCTTLSIGTFSGSVISDIYVPWSEGEVEGAPWGAENATIHYNYTGGTE